MLKTDSKIFIYSYAYATMKPKVTLRLFSAFQGAYAGLLPEINFRSSHASYISNTPTFFSVIYKKVNRNGFTPKTVQFLIQYGHYDKLIRKLGFFFFFFFFFFLLGGRGWGGGGGNFTIPF